MTVIESGGEIFVCDVGFQFQAETDAPGIDYCLPNIHYLERVKKQIKAVFITHAHLDHIGGIPFILDRIGNPPIYTRPLTALLLKKRQEEFPHKPKLKITIMRDGSAAKFRNTVVSTFPVTHSIPDSMGLKFKTPEGNILLSGDLKLDHVDGVPTPDERRNYAALGREKNLLFIADSTNAERPGFSITEREVQENLAAIVRRTKDRLIVGTFASQFARMIRLIEVAQECSRKVVLEGRSIRNNLEIAKAAGLLQVHDKTIISAAQSKKLEGRQVLVLATGAQGEEFASLNRMATGAHKDIKLCADDTILLSSSVIPGNELAVQGLKDRLHVHGVQLVHYRTSDVHSTGHGYSGEMIWINQQINAKYFMPAYGFKSMTRAHADAVVAAGFPRSNVILAENGSVIEFASGQMRVNKTKVPSTAMMVDGLTVGDIPELLVSERQTLGKSGFCVVILTVTKKHRRLVGSPEIVARGFFYGPAKEGLELQKSAKLLVQKTYQKALKVDGARKIGDIRNMIRDRVAQLLASKTGKNPMVLPVFIEA